jgi:hypothetical protein
MYELPLAGSSHQLADYNLQQRVTDLSRKKSLKERFRRESGSPERHIVYLARHFRAASNRICTRGTECVTGHVP